MLSGIRTGYGNGNDTPMDILSKYAQLLVQYCLEVKEGERLLVSSTTLAEPLVREVYRHALKAGAQVEVSLSFREQGRILLEEGSEEVLKRVPPLYSLAMEEFDLQIDI